MLCDRSSQKELKKLGEKTAKDLCNINNFEFAIGGKIRKKTIQKKKREEIGGF